MGEWKISLEEFLKRITMDLNETFRGTSKGYQGIPQIRIFHNPNFSLDKPVIHAVD